MLPIAAVWPIFPHIYGRTRPRRAIRRQEVVIWHGSDVESIRKRVTIRAYTCLIIYTASVAWINLCYVFTYDAPAIRWGCPGVVANLSGVAYRHFSGNILQALAFTIGFTTVPPSTSLLPYAFLLQRSKIFEFDSVHAGLDIFRGYARQADPAHHGCRQTTSSIHAQKNVPSCANLTFI